MALTKKEANFLGFTTDLYTKISGSLVREIGKDEEGKLYSVEIQIDNFTNETKEYQINQITKKFEGLREVELTLPTYYKKLIETEDYKTFTNA